MWSRVPLAILLATTFATTSPGQDKPAPKARVDFQGDPLPEGARARIGTLRLRHGHEIQDVAFSPDGTFLASAAFDHTVRLWDPETGKEVRRFTTEEERANPYSTARWMHSISFSPDGKKLACAEYNKGWPANQIRVWDVATAKLLYTMKGSQRGVPAVAFSPDGRLLATGGYDATITLWDGANGEPRLRLTGHEGHVFSVAWNTKGDLLASGGADRTIRLWDPATGREKSRFVGHQAEVTSVQFSPDGKSVASAGADHKVRLWNAATGEEQRVLSRHDDAVLRAVFSPDGKLITSASADKTIKLWDVATGEWVRSLEGHARFVRSVSFAPDGKTLASGSEDGRVALWDVATGKERHASIGHQAAILGFVSGGAKLVAFGGDDTIRWWDWKQGKVEHALPWKSHFPAPATSGFSPNGELLSIGSRQGPLRLVEATTGKERGSLDARDLIVAAAFSPDGQTIAATAALNPRQKQLEGKGVTLWDTRTRERVRSVADKVDGLQLILFAPDGKLFLSGTATSYLWDVAKDKLLGEPLPLPFAELKSASFTPDNRILACGDMYGNVQLWDVEIGEKVRVLSGLKGYVQVLSISPDSRLLAAGGWRGIKVWEIETGLERRTFDDFEGDVYSLAFTPDGRVLASGSGGQQIHIWDIPSLPPPDAKTAEVLALWKDLAAADGGRVHRAIWGLAAQPAEAVAFLKTMLKPIPAVAGPRLAQLMENLDSDVFVVREKATKEIQALGEVAEPALRKIVIESASLEVKQRARSLLAHLAKFAATERWQKSRAIEVLEYIGTPDASAVLQSLADGAAEARFTRDAMASLKRVQRNAAATGR